MNAKDVKIAILSAAITAALTTGIQTFAQHDMNSMQGQHGVGSMMGQRMMPHMEPGAMQIHQVMMQSAQMMVNGHMPMEKDTDRMFAAMMVPHHEDAIKMAKIELARGNDAPTKALAKKILDAQTKEKATLARLAKTAH